MIPLLLSNESSPRIQVGNREDLDWSTVATASARPSWWSPVAHHQDYILPLTRFFRIALDHADALTIPQSVGPELSL